MSRVASTCIPSLLRPLVLAFACCGAQVSAQTEPPAAVAAPPAASGPNVLLITLDATRADTLAPWGGGGGAPNLDALAAESIVAATARATAPLTLPSHASMMTGLNPVAHGVRANDLFRLAPEANTVAESLRKAGWRTEAVPGSTALRAATGIDQGFDRVRRLDLRRVRNRALDVERRAEDVTAIALERLAVTDPRPWFLWLHYADPNLPYAAPDGPPMSAGREALYAAEVHYMDAQIGRVIARLRESGALARTWIVVCGASGEGLARQQELTHGFLCEEGTLRVPFFARAPDGALRGRVETLTSTADVAPTLLEIAGIAPATPMHGRSLLALHARERASGPDVDRAVWFESSAGWRHYRWHPLEGVVVGSMKYVQNVSDELFDLTPLAAASGGPAPDPEATNRASAAPDVSRQLASRLAALKAEPPPPLSAAPAPLTAFEAGRIAALGYVAPPAPETPEGNAGGAPPAIDPRVGYVAWVEMQNAQALSQRKRHDEAIAIAMKFAGVPPPNAAMLQETGRLLLVAGRHDEAAEKLQEALALDPESIATSYLLGLAFRDQNELGQAANLFEHTVELSPIHFDAWIALRNVREKSGELEQALLAHVQAILVADQFDRDEDVERLLDDMIDGRLPGLCHQIATRLSATGVGAARSHALALFLGRPSNRRIERAREILSEPQW